MPPRRPIRVADQHAAVAALVGFAADRSPELVASVGLAPPVAIGLGGSPTVPRRDGGAPVRAPLR